MTTLGFNQAIKAWKP